MAQYRPKASVNVPSVTGAIVQGSAKPQFEAWKPSTWPAAPKQWNATFVKTIAQIFQESILDEIDNVISDAKGDLNYRGHVVAIALFCALDAISSYGYGARSGKQIPDFVRAHFPLDYRPHAKSLLELYRHAMIHSWNLFEVAIQPGNEPITSAGGILGFGLLSFRKALDVGTSDFLNRLAGDVQLQTRTRDRYEQLRGTAKQ
jgi:hypothetical protein